MRCVKSFNMDWYFFKNIEEIPQEIEGGEQVCLPHTWNNIDGQDGGNDYLRCECAYVKRVRRSDLPKTEKVFLEIGAANSVGRVYINGKLIAEHKGGYSLWRVDITDKIEDSGLIIITVDNRDFEDVYPSVADFTFYGGLYRGVNLIGLSASHFDVEHYGTPGIKVTPMLCAEKAKIDIEVYPCNFKSDQKLRYSIYDGNMRLVCQALYDADKTVASFKIDEPVLWDGVGKGHLYNAEVELVGCNGVIDVVRARFGVRSFIVDAERGFFLNGNEYALRGVSRHQDWRDIGNALGGEHHRRDIELIRELGANCIRLAHYQHDPYFYDLCDEAGIIVWAEIPYISKHKASANENALGQMRELIVQCYNHPCICFWGLSNEITMSGADDPNLIENHKRLNSLVHELDKSRLTTVAALSSCPTDAEYLAIPDLIAYNHYFGWYGGDVSMNGEWLDRFHMENPTRPIGVSEYGCEALDWHTDAPEQGDYTEEYQAYYHEELIKQLYTRPYLWSTFVWIMFDFGADARAEGGENGINHKGLVTFDRTYKKDAFYAYKAWLSKDPFVHICSKRYVDRVGETTKIKVYSNQPAVELVVDGERVGKMQCGDHFFVFEIKNAGEQNITAIAGNCKDEARIRRVEKPNDSYKLKETGTVLNWFDIEMPEGMLSINDKIDLIMKTSQGQKIILGIAAKISSVSGETGFSMNDDMMRMMGGFTLLRICSMAGMMNVSFTKEELVSINKALNSIKRPE